MGWRRAFAVIALAAAAAALAVSGGDGTDPRTPRGLPELPPPFLGVAVIGGGGRTAAVDAYGNVVDLRAPGPAGRALVSVSAERQAAGSVDAREALVARVSVGGRWRPLWQADAVRQRYLTGTNVLRTVARFGRREAAIVRRVGGPQAARRDRRWLARTRPLGPRAPAWARRMYLRSLLVLRALTDRRSGAVAAGARDGWAYVWPRDAAAVAIALASAGYRSEARRVARFLRRLDLGAAARFDGTGAAVPGRAAQGDAGGWVAAAMRAGGLARSFDWRGKADYQEGEPGDFLGNAIAAGLGSGQLRDLFGAPDGLTRVAGEAASGLDTTAAWAVEPFPRPGLFPVVRQTLHRLVAGRDSRYGLLPSENWHGGEDPWTAPTAWTAWALAALRDRRAALLLMADLRRAATPLGLLPERVDAVTGAPRSTTPLAWSHAFAILALRELWPSRGDTKPAA